MSDLIDRQAALDAINSGMLTDDDTQFECPSECNSMLEWAVNAVKELPTSEKKGKWIDGNEGKWNAVYCPKCSVCGTPFYGIETVRYHYCPNCGARMEG